VVIYRLLIARVCSEALVRALYLIQPVIIQLVLVNFLLVLVLACCLHCVVLVVAPSDSVEDVALASWEVPVGTAAFPASSVIHGSSVVVHPTDRTNKADHRSAEQVSPSILLIIS
jgi:hypothetical protein